MARNRFLSEPTPWAMGVEHALHLALQTIAHGVGSYKNQHMAVKFSWTRVEQGDLLRLGHSV